MNLSKLSLFVVLPQLTCALTLGVANAQTRPNSAPPRSSSAPEVAVEPSKIELFKMIGLQRDREVRNIVFRGTSPDLTDERGDHALLVAARDGWLEGVNVLLELGAKVNLRNKWGDTALMVAALNGNEAVVKALRAKGGDINNTGWTALHYASLGGHDNIVKYLLDQGANPAAQSQNGVTAMMMAARENRTEAIKVLLEYGADPAQKNQKGETAYDWAVREEHRASVQLLASKATPAKSK